MGTSWYFLNLDLKEYLRPINGWKAWEIIANHPGVCEVLANMMLNDERWNGCRIQAVGDPDEEILGFKDITIEAIIRYNSEFMEWPKWGPENFYKHIILLDWPIKANAKIIARLESDLKQMIEWDLERDITEYWRGWEWSQTLS